MSQRIGVVLLGHLGDVLLGSSVLKPIRRQFPDAEIVMIGSRFARELFTESPHTDRLVDFEQLCLGPWRDSRFRRRRMLARMTRTFWAPALTVDKLVLPVPYVSRYFLDALSLVKGREVIGYSNGPFVDGQAQYGKSDADWTRLLTKPVAFLPNYRFSHLRTHHLRLLDELGCKVESVDDLPVEIPLTDADRATAASLVEATDDGGLGIVFPGASFNRQIKIWPIKRYADVIMHLGERAPSRWLVCGAENEEDTCSKVADAICTCRPHHRVDVACGKPLKQIAALLERAKLAIGADNGGMHMAVATGTPSVAIVSGAARVLYFPWGDPARHRAVMHPMDCWECTYSCIHESVECIVKISADRVAEACAAVMEAKPGPARRAFSSR